MCVSVHMHLEREQGTEEFLEEALRNSAIICGPEREEKPGKQIELWLVGRRKNQEADFLNLREEECFKRRGWQTT